jgi:hypothetical protein
MAEEQKKSIKESVSKIATDWNNFLTKLEKIGIQKIEVYAVMCTGVIFFFSLRYGVLSQTCILLYYIFALSKERKKNGNNYRYYE